MTEKTTERDLPVRDRRGTAGTLARPLTDEERACELLCWVRHPSAGGSCERPATTMVYGLLFCDEHGPEAMAGALEELYGDAEYFLERLDNPHVPAPNAEAERAIEATLRELARRRKEHETSEEEEAALRRAYPMIPERVCPETVAFDYHFGPNNMYGPDEQPTEVYHHARRLLCKQMRTAYGEDADWLVEILEYEREGVSAQLAWALEDYERKVGTEEEREQRRAAARTRRDPVAEVLGQINSNLSSASNHLSEDVPVEAFADEEDYWRARRAIAEAGGLVVKEEGRRRKREAGHQPAE